MRGGLHIQKQSVYGLCLLPHGMSWMEIIHIIFERLHHQLFVSTTSWLRDYLILDILKVHTKNLNSTHRTLMHAVDIVVYNAANWNNDTYLHAKSTKFLLP